MCDEPSESSVPIKNDEQAAVNIHEKRVACR